MILARALLLLKDPDSEDNMRKVTLIELQVHVELKKHYKLRLD